MILITPDGRSLLFSRLVKMLGLSFTEATQKACMENPTFFDFQHPFEDTDLENMYERIKHMNIGKEVIYYNLSESLGRLCVKDESE